MYFDSYNMYVFVMYLMYVNHELLDWNWSYFSYLLTIHYPEFLVLISDKMFYTRKECVDPGYNLAMVYY